MDEGKKSILMFDFGRKLGVEFYGAKVTRDADFLEFKGNKKFCRICNFAVTKRGFRHTGIV